MEQMDRGEQVQPVKAGKPTKPPKQSKRRKRRKPSPADVPAAEGQRVIRLRRDRNDRGAGAVKRFRPKDLQVGDWVWKWTGWFAQAIDVQAHQWKHVLRKPSEGSPAAVPVDGWLICWRSDCRACGASHEVWRAISTMPRPSYCSPCYFAWLQRRRKALSARKASWEAKSAARRARWADAKIGVISDANVIAKSTINAE